MKVDQVKLEMIGCSHKNVAVQFRERLAFSPAECTAALAQFRERFPNTEVVLLSTCNRVELYVAAPDAGDCPGPGQLIQFLAAAREIPPEPLLDRLIHRTSGEVVSHLFRVTSAMDSLVVGEAQIPAQVKQAYEHATAAGTTGPLLHATFQAASRVAKRVQHETSIHRRRVSIPSVAVGEIVPEFFETLADKKILLIGAGEMGGETLRYLRDAGAKQIAIVNRSKARGEELAALYGGSSVAWEDRLTQMVHADLIVSTTGSSEPVVTLAEFRPVHAARYERLLLILDLAVPRDFAAEIGDLPGVYLYSIDDLQASADRNRREREREWPRAQRIIDEETALFLSQLQARSTGPVIRQLRELAESIKEAELQRLLNRLQGPQLSEQHEAEIAQSFERLVNKLLHSPLTSLRDDAASGHRQGLLDALRRLFQLGD